MLLRPEWSGLPDVEQHEVLVYTVGTKRYPQVAARALVRVLTDDLL